MKPERVLNNMWARIAVGGLATLSIAGIYTGRPYLERLFNPPPAASAPKGDNNKDNNVGALVLTPTVSPDGIPIITITVPDTATAVSIVEPSVTNVPATATENPSPTAENTKVPATNTVESTKTPEVKPVLANYAVYSNGKDLVIADLPPDKDHPTDPHRIFMYSAIDGLGPEVLDWTRTGDNSFNAISEVGSKGGWDTIPKAVKDDTNKVLSGEYQINGVSTYTSFKLNAKEPGLTSLLHECEAVKTIALKLGSGHIPDATMLDQINQQIHNRYKSNLRDNEIPYLHP